MLAMAVATPVAAFVITDEQRAILRAAGIDPDKAMDGCSPPPASGPERLAYFESLIAKSQPFKNPDEQRPVSAESQYKLEVKYTDPETTNIAGCKLRLRSYNGKLVGDTIRARPGDTLYIKVINNLPVDALHPHPQDPAPSDHHGHFSFNITNLHTHGLHTSPEGISDNVLLTIRPGKFQDYEVHIHKNHPTGTFWYHAHLHGSTAVQVSSGMAGALIIENHDVSGDARGGLDTVPAIKAAKEKVFVLQKILYGPRGHIETFDPFKAGRTLERLATINGQLIPTIEMQPGEVQRWRFIHASVVNEFRLALQGHELHEIAADGIALGRMVPWKGEKNSALEAERTPILIGPGYRVDVLVKAKSPGTYYLMNGAAPPVVVDPVPVTGQTPAAISLERIRTATALATERSLEKASQLTADLPEALRAELHSIVQGGAVLTDKVAQILQRLPPVPETIIARVIVKDVPPVDMEFPTPEELKDRVPSDLDHIEASELTGAHQNVFFQVGERRCKPDGDCSEVCESKDPKEPDYDPACKVRFMIGHRLYSPERIRRLKLGQTAEWTLRGNFFAHPFHIHVNPFRVEREEPRNRQMVKDWVWKDVILMNPDPNRPISFRTRYTRFTGKFVIHCHILDHEDRGMMEVVEITE
jgi:FtsP/CotA-like multicopper oxidase with cupredoxin domain